MPDDRIAKRIKQSPAAQKALGWSFEHLSFLIPAKRLKETPTLIAFYHPRPCYKVHVLIVPKKALSSLMEVKNSDADFLLDLVKTTQELVKELALEPEGYRLIVNGGANQDLPQLHFHLVSGKNL
jgi:histidine triad (HIT) family protein